MYMIADFAYSILFVPLSSARTSAPFSNRASFAPLNNARTSAPLRVGTPTFNRLTSHAWSSLFLYRHASCACIHTCRCFKILFPATDPYASSLVVLQSLMKYCPQTQIISMPDSVEQCSEASCRYELLYSISPYSFRLPHIDARTISSQLLCDKWWSKRVERQNDRLSSKFSVIH